MIRQRKISKRFDRPFHQRKECCVEAIWYFDLVRILTQEEHTLIDELADDKSKNLAEVAA